MKRKNILAVATMLLAMSATAQTNFRHITYDEAINAAKAENKLVFMDFYTDWCGPCKMMMREVFPQKEVGDFMNEKFVCIKLNAEKEGKELAKLYKVKAYPTFIAIDTNKNIVLTKVGGGSANAFVEEIDRMLDPNKSPERMKERYESGERTPELVSAYAAYLVSESQKGKNTNMELENKAYDIVNSYFDNLSDADKLSPKNLFIYENYIQGTDCNLAKYMVAHHNDFDPAIKQKTDEIIGEMFKRQIYYYFNGHKDYDEKVYSDAKRDIQNLNLNADKEYDNVYKFIECHAKGDLNAYLDLCEKEFSSLSKEQQNSLLSGFAKMINTDDKTIRQRASKFLKSLLADMNGTTILFTAYQIMELDGENNH